MTQLETPATCPYCGSAAKLVDSAVIYGGRSYGPAWACSHYPACDAYVGCHPGTTRPLGNLAGKDLRAARMAAHKSFDRLWGGRGKRLTNRERKARGLMPRSAAYRWLAQQMGLEESGCHIGEFDVDQCRQVVELCKRKLNHGDKME